MTLTYISVNELKNRKAGVPNQMTAVRVV